MRDDDRMTGRDELDGRIDAAVRNYAEPPETTAPRVALAQVMERARRERRTRGIRRWMWGMAGAAACLIAVMVAVWVTRGPRMSEIAPAPQAPGVIAVPYSVAQPAVAQVRTPVIRRAMRPRRTPTGPEAAPLPKLAVFPTPRPLSPEEQALVAFAQHGPPAVQHAVLEDQKHWDDPIIVAGLSKQPLQSGNQQDQ